MAKQSVGARQTIATYGRRPHTVTVASLERRGERVTVVFWREGGVRKEQTIDGRTRRDQESAARAFAEQKHAVLLMKAQGVVTAIPRAERLTLEQLYPKYLLAEGRSWAPATTANHRARWMKFQRFVGARTRAEDVSLETMDEFCAAMKAATHAPGEIDRMVTAVKSVYRFAVGRVDGFSSKVVLFRLKKLPGDRPKPVPEYAPAEVRALLAELKPRGRRIGPNGLKRDWRPWATCWLTAASGKRTRSQMLPLQWTSVHWHRGGATIDWPWEHDKLRKEHRQPMPRRAAAMLRLIRWLARQEGVESPYVLPARQDNHRRRTKPWFSYTGLVAALHAACGRCGVAYRKGRAMHGFRRYAANTSYDVGGGTKGAGGWLNNGDLRTIERAYLRERTGEQAALAAKMPSPDGRVKRKVRATGAVGAGSGGATSASNDGPTTDAPVGAGASRS